MRKVIIVSVISGALLLLIAGLLLPEKAIIPVQGASSKDWNKDTFWFEPWGTSGVHKGIDIFSHKGTPVISATKGLVVFAGKIKKGGNAIAVLGPKWRIHYYSHLNTIDISPGVLINRAHRIGSVGNTGNAQNKPAHLHYSVVTLLPYFWRWDRSVTQGWKKIFFLDPGKIAHNA